MKDQYEIFLRSVCFWNITVICGLSLITKQALDSSFALAWALLRCINESRRRLVGVLNSFGLNENRTRVWCFLRHQRQTVPIFPKCLVTVSEERLFQYRILFQNLGLPISIAQEDLKLKQLNFAFRQSWLRNFLYVNCSTTSLPSR